MWKPEWKEEGTNEFFHPDNHKEEMTTANMSGKKFILKRSCQDIVSRWKLQEELVLIQLVQQHLKTDSDIDDIDIDTLAMQYSQLVDNNDLHPKTQEQITRKLISFLNDDKVCKTLLKEQVRLNWFS